MNILKLLNSLSLTQTSFSELSSEQIRRIEKQIQDEKRPDWDTNTITLLTNALRNDASSLEFIAKHSFFGKIFIGEQPRSQKGENVTDTEKISKIKNFLNTYFHKDLVSYFEKNYAENNFRVICEFLNYKEFFTENFMNFIQQKMYERVDFATLTLKETPEQAKSKVNYISYISFYQILSAIKSAQTDEKVKNLLGVSVSSSAIENNFWKETIKAMTSYEAVDQGLLGTLKSNRNAIYNAEINTPSASEKNKISPWTIVIVVLIILKIIRFLIVSSR